MRYGLRTIFLGIGVVACLSAVFITDQRNPALVGLFILLGALRWSEPPYREGKGLPMSASDWVGAALVGGFLGVVSGIIVQRTYVNLWAINQNIDLVLALKWGGPLGVVIGIAYGRFFRHLAMFLPW